jgi:adenine-specific DNA methylase
LAALWPDPADPQCPERFRIEAAARMQALRDRRGGPPRDWHDPLELRATLLDFIADFANWDLSNDRECVETARALVQVAHESLGGAPATRPLVFDPFAGGGTIPLEALRVGADAFASDLNPVAVLLNKVVLEYVPRYGARLAQELRARGHQVRSEAAKELEAFYPRDADGATPIAYLWARTIRCEGPGCGAELPLMRSLWLAKKGARAIALRLVPNTKQKRIDFQIVDGAKEKVADGTIRKGSATCPVCGYTTPNARVRAQLTERHGGAADARLVAVVTARSEQQGRTYRLPTERDLAAARAAAEELRRRAKAGSGTNRSLVPDEPIPTERPSPNARGLSAVTRMGVRTFGDLFAPRAALTLTTLNRLVEAISDDLSQTEEPGLAAAVASCLALAVDRQADFLSSLVTWTAGGEFVGHTFTRQALSIVWDFAECNPWADASGNWDGAIEWIAKVAEGIAAARCAPGHVEQASATAHPLPNDAAHALITDPPYYDAVPYSDLSEFFFVWLRRSLGKYHPDLFGATTVPKDEEAIWNPSRIYSKTGRPKDESFYEQQMHRAFAEARRVVAPNGIGVVVFAHKSTAGWEAILSALLRAGWIATASWPIDTERASRTNALGTASLASSVHIVCRPREDGAGAVRSRHVGDWRAVLEELPIRMREWLPRLAKEGVVGADAIFACLGPALEIFSRYSSVEKVSGEVVSLREYLEQVWAAVSKEALSMIFEDADTAGLEEDARLTAIWLWTLAGPGVEKGLSGDEQEESDAEADDDADVSMANAASGFTLEYDAARKIAQGLGARLEELEHVVEVKGDKARLLPVAERTKHLFGKSESVPTAKKAAKRKQMTLFAELDQAAELQGWGEVGAPKAGTTTLDRVHQAMLLFASGRSEALKRFLLEEGVGKQAQFWKLGQSLSALYPSGSDEKRWVDGVLARKKGLGFG